MDLQIQGRVAIVGGSSRGMGKAIAMGLAREGVNVTICARDAEAVSRAAEEIAATAPEQVLAFSADLSRREETERVVRETARRWGHIDIVVNNIGGPPLGQPSALDDAQWYAALELNFLSAVRMSREALPHMRQRGWGRIINLLSIAVKEPVENLALSTGSRMAVVGFAKMLSDEVTREGITVNNVLPGRILTDRLRSLAGTRAQQQGIDTDEVLRQMSLSVPAQRLGKPEEMADLVCFLASERASYISGTSILLDGGLSRSTL